MSRVSTIEQINAGSLEGRDSYAPVVFMAPLQVRSSYGYPYADCLNQA